MRVLYVIDYWEEWKKKLPFKCMSIKMSNLVGLELNQFTSRT